MTTLNATPIFQTPGSFITAIRERGTVLHIATQEGIIYRGTAGAVFLDIRPDVLFSGEMGLLGLAFHPTTSTRFFLWYSEEPNVATPPFNHINRLEEWRIVNGVPQRFVTLIRIPTIGPNHNGLNNIFYDSQLGRLIIATGDGGDSTLAQDDDSLLGKLISVDVDSSFWQTHNNTTPVTQVSALGVFASVISVISKGIRNPTRLDQKAGFKFMSVAGNTNREFAFAFKSYGKNFGWRAFEGSVPTIAGSTVAFPIEVNLLLQRNLWGSIVSYANANATGLTPPVLRGIAMTGIDYYQGSIPQIQNNLIFTDLSNEVFQASLPPAQITFEQFLRIPHGTRQITVNNLTGSISTMYVTSDQRLLVAHGNGSTSTISELTA